MSGAPDHTDGHIVRLNPTCVDRLARHLHFTMERLDPTEENKWDLLNEDRRDFYRECVREVFWEISSEPALVRVLAQRVYRPRRHRRALQDLRKA